MKTIRKLALRDMLMHKSRTVMTMIAIMLSCALITVISGMGTSAWQSYIYACINSYGDFDVTLTGDFNDKNIADIKRNRDVDGVYYERNIGVAKIPENVSVYKPYVLVHGLNAGALENCFNAKLSEGRFPENDSEIVLSPMFEKYSEKKYHIGDKIKLGLGYRVLSELLYYDTSYSDGERLEIQQEKEYTVVGILDSVSSKVTCFYKSACVDVYTLTDSVKDIWTTDEFNGTPKRLWVNYTDSAEKDYISATAQLVGVSDKEVENCFFHGYDISSKKVSDGNDFGITGFTHNEAVLTAKGIGFNNTMNISMLITAAVLILIIIFMSIFIIRNSISISVTEKTKLFGMLSAVGATPRQIKNSVIFEGMVLTIFGVPFGIGLGTGVTFALVNICGNILKDSLNGNELLFSIPLWAVLLSAVLGMMTVFVSSMMAAWRVSKMSAIDAVRLSGEIKNSQNYRVPKLIRKIFHEGGCIAWKNMKRSKRQYRTTIVSLVLSVTIFLAASTAVGSISREVSETFATNGYNLSVEYYSHSSWKTSNVDETSTDPDYHGDLEIPNYADRENRNEEYKNFFEEIAKNSNVDTWSYCFQCREYSFDIPQSELYESKTGGVPDIMNYSIENGVLKTNLCIMAVDDSAYKEIIKSTGKTPEELKGKAVFVNDNRKTIIHDDDSREVIYEPFFKNPVGMTLNGNIKLWDPDDKYDGKRGSVSIEIGAELTSAQLLDEKYFVNIYERSGSIIIPLDDYMNTIEGWFTYGGMFINSSNSIQLESDIGNMGKSGIYVENIDAYVKMMNAIVLLIEIFVYGFIAVITLIGVTNIFNTVSTNMKLRQKEFAMLRSVGMTGKEFDRMIILESIFCSFKALLIGIPFGLLTGWLIYFLIEKMSYTGHSIYIFPLTAVILSITVVVMIVGSIMFYSVSKLKKQNIIETIRNENV